jgi:hypothetical protein
MSSQPPLHPQRFVPSLARRSCRGHNARRAPRALTVRRGEVEVVDIQDIIDRQFVAFDPAYHSNRDLRGDRLDALKEQIRPEARRSRDLMIEAEWLRNYTTDWKRLDRQLDLLAESLASGDQDMSAQNEEGSWGGYSEWFERLNSTLETIYALAPAAGSQPPVFAHKLAFLRGIGSRASLIPYLYGRQISDISSNGVYQRHALLGIQQTLSQFLFKPELRSVVIANGAEFMDDDYAASYIRFLDATQDDVSAFWGPWLLIDGALRRVADLGITYHTVSSRRGRVKRVPQLVDTLYAIKDLPYPFGWKHNGEYNNHNSFEVARILRLAWDQMQEYPRRHGTEWIQAMLDWALSPKSIDADGAFVPDPTFYDSTGELYYFGIAFLVEIGFWKPEKRFWTDDRAPHQDAERLYTQLRANLARLLATSDAAKEALAMLDQNRPAAGGG